MKNSGQRLLIILLVVFFTGCEDREATDSDRVTATPAYKEQFGTPPVAREGTCFAMVGFLPLQRDPSLVSAIPIFTFAWEGRKELLVRHLIGLGEDALLARPELINPFPPGTSLEFIESGKEVLRVELNFPDQPPGEPHQIQGILSALGFSLSQFEGAPRVLVTTQGKPLPHEAPEGFFPTPHDIVSPGEPRLLQVAGVWEKGKRNPEEVSIFFDRPVDIDDIQAVKEDGQTLEGDYFRSVFDMAVVIRPERPESIQEKMPVEITWRAVDRLGRTGEGKETFALKRIEHP